MIRAKLYDLRDESEFVIHKKKEQIKTYIAMMVRFAGDPDPKSIAFETIRNIVISLSDSGGSTNYGLVASRFKEEGYDYKKLGYKKFSDMASDAERAGYVVLKTKENGTKTMVAD
jgi:hypothetical protein